jgi:hypothetical protein
MLVVGGITNTDQVEEILSSSADRVFLNTTAFFYQINCFLISFLFFIIFQGLLLKNFLLTSSI